LQVGSQAWSQVRSQVRLQVGSQVRSQVRLQVGSQAWSQVRSQVRLQVGSQVRSQVRSQVELQVGSQVRSQVWSQVRSQVESQVRSQVWSQVRSQVESQVELQVKKDKNLMPFVYPWLDGHFMSSYFSFFNFMNEVLGIKFEVQEKYDWYQKTSEVGFIYPLDKICIISDRPESIKMKNGVLHCDNAPAIRYTDGFSIWCLNGVSVPQEIIETSAEKLNPELIVKEQNAEVRREIVRKIGIDRVCQKLGARVLDKQGDYELIDINLGENRYRPYLKMKNPSIGVFHIEGVATECKTVQEALKWRNKTEEKPLIVT
jgi:hypothetical protein